MPGWRAHCAASAGITERVLSDNDRGLMVSHDRATRELEFNDRLHALAHD